MSPIFDPLNLFLLAIAAVVLWRLKSVLGTRTGEERPPADVTIFKPRQERQKVATPGEPMITMGSPEPSKPVWQGFADENSAVARGLQDIAKSSPGFDVAQFLDGAKRAYEMILSAYAKGDKQALKPLLGREVLDTFNSVIDQRNRDGSTMVFQFVGVNKAHIERASLAGPIASMTLRFRSDMIHALRGKDGDVIDGDDRAVREVEDTWTFERDIGSRDPNWRLVSTDDDVG
jgi:predicted lipid-binding transport protein (Tim44 family)